MSRVDVIIPCYKYAHYLEGCVESVLSQGVDVRALIIDDCSPDDTPAVGARIVAGDSRVEYRRHEVNKRHIATYNEGLEWATGDYTLLLSADDLLAPTALMRAVSFLDANPEVGLLHGDCRDFETDPPLHEATDALEAPVQVQRGEEYVAEAAAHGYNQVHTPTAITRTALQQRIGGYRVDLPHSADMEMWLRFAAYSDVARLDAVQAFYRVHGQNMHLALASTTLADLEHRKLTWDVYFREHGAAFPDLELLQDTANESLARDALGEAFKSFGEGDTRACRSFISLAKQAYPACRDWRLYGRLQWMLRAGPAAWGLMRKVMGRSPENAAAN